MSSPTGRLGQALPPFDDPPPSRIILNVEQKEALLEKLDALRDEIRNAEEPSVGCGAPSPQGRCVRHKGHTGAHSSAFGEIGNGDEGGIPKPVLKEAVRLLNWYMSDESNPDHDTILMLTNFSVYPDRFADDPDLFTISATSVEVHGPVGEVSTQHDTLEQLRGDGTLVRLWEDGVAR